MRTVYGVASGEYSDYFVDCLFETEELAQQYIDAREEAARRGRKAKGLPVDERRTYGLWYPRVEEFQLWDAVPVLKDE